MRPRLSDTRVEAQAVWAERLRTMTPAEKARRISELVALSTEMALAGLRTRHPDEPEGRLLLRLARIRLGDEVVRSVYGEEAVRP